MSLSLAILPIPLIIALLPFFVHKDTDKPRKLLRISQVIIICLAVIGATAIWPKILLSTLFPVFLIPLTFILSLGGFILEIAESRGRGIKVLWSTSFLALISLGVLIFYFLFFTDTAL